MELLDIPLPASHPAGHGLLRIRGTVSDGVVERAEVVTGLMHRGAEKLFESRDYRQILSLANRHDWLSSFDGELSAARVMEDALGITVPPRAQVLRTMLSEACRITHHLYWLGETVAALGGDATALRQARTELTRALDLVTGARMHLMIVRIGGLSMDLSDQWREALPDVDPRGCLDEVAPRLAGVATLSRGQAIDFATSGVVARASGWDRDLREHVPHVVRDEGDALARMRCLADEIAVSTEYLRSARIPAGEVGTRLPRTIRLPEGEYYGASETASGINGWWVVSRGDLVPWRMKMRTASFNNAAALPAVLPGTPVDDLPAAFMSFLLVAGDMDK
ncbi:MAG TPA: NADH-quinone oxidoreductase subunit D [Actinomycetota bacterium]|nr:NADH-quinone oxidoreductase subunit D [Actinomycetota bacterium]